MTALRRLPILAAILALALVAGCGGGGSKNKVAPGDVATVNGQPISKTAFDHWLNIVFRSQQTPGSKTKPKMPKPGSTQYNQIRDQTTSFLVSALWILGEAKDRGVSVTPAEVQKQFKQTRDQSFPTVRAYNRFLQRSGQTQADIDFRVRADVLANKVREAVTRDTANVSNSDIEDYYKKNEQQFSQPERRDLHVILNKDQGKAQEALRRLQSGDNFKAVVRDLSQDPATKQQGGQMLGVTKGQQEAALDKAAFSAPKNKLEGPIKTSRGYWVFEVTRITPPTKQSLAQSREGIRQLLISQKQQQSLDAFTTDFRKKWRDRTKCAKGYVTQDCSNGPLPPGTPGAPGSGAPATSGTGKPPALGGAQTTPTAGTIPGLGGAAAAGGGPPALGGPGGPPALSGSPTQGAPGVGGATQVPQGAAPQGAAPQGAAPQGAAPQGAAPQGGQATPPPGQ